MPRLPRVSIIIPHRRDRAHLDECVSHCLNLDYPDYEIIGVSNTPLPMNHPRVKVVLTGRIGQADKRDIGIEHASGEICAFIDEDAYPERDWLKNAVWYFRDPGVAVLGGPGRPPPSASLRRRAAGAVYVSMLGSGPLRHRYAPEGLDG